jgi:pyruvate-formate lyase-activating enzyme
VAGDWAVDDGVKADPGSEGMKRRRFNWVLSDIIRAGLKPYLEWKAWLRGERFHCRALAGESEYNICINCDLTVSCSCQDYDGSGHIGDLNRNTFREVFFGPVAQRFREQLAKGKLPIKTCTRCGDLERRPKSAPIPAPRLPYRGLMLENTVRCNLDCIGCDRQSAARIRTTPQMDLNRLSRMADLVHELGIQTLCYLNLGEPFLSPNIGPELEVLRRKNPDCNIWISTNGIVLNTDARRAAALHASRIYFSIAGVNDEMLVKYERRGSFQKAYANMKALVEYRNARGLSQPLLEWKYLLFNWNDHPRTIERAIELARAAGVDFISFWPTHNPFYGWSYRYALGRLNHIGIGNWKGRELDLRPSSAPATAGNSAAAEAPALARETR